MCAQSHMYLHVCIPLVSQPRSDTHVGHPGPGFQPHLQRRNHGSLEQWLILRLGQETYKSRQDHLVEQKSKEVLREEKPTKGV